MEIEDLIDDLGVHKAGQKATILRRLKEGAWVSKSEIFEEINWPKDITFRLGLYELRKKLRDRNYDVMMQTAYRLVKRGK